MAADGDEEQASAECRYRFWRLRDVDAVVLTAEAPPAAVLGMDDARNEAEVIVDPGLLLLR